MTVSVSSRDRADVTLLFATGLKDISPPGCVLHGDLNMVLKLLWRRTFEEFEIDRMDINDTNLYRRSVAWHKREIVTIDGITYVTSFCNSMRPAFLVQSCAVNAAAHEEGKDESKEVMHLYCAMSLPGAHDHQQVVLGRFANHALAVCFVKAAQDLLGVPYSD